MSNTLEISPVVIGLWQIADIEKDGREIDANEYAGYLQEYVDAGFTTIDMADHYGSAEVIAGVCKQNSAIPVQLMTKWVPKPGKLSPIDVRKAVDKALMRLGTDSIDLLQYHAWNYADPSYLDQLLMLQQLKEEGLIRNLGVTNFDTPHLKMVLDSGIELVSNQISYSLIDQRAASEMSTVCREYGVGILAYGTLAGGFLSEKWLNQPEPTPEDLTSWSLMKYKRFIDEAGGWQKFQDLLNVLEKVAGELEVTIPLVASRYIIESPSVQSVIIGARLGESQHISDHRKLLSLELNTEHKEMIQSAMDTLDRIPGSPGDEYRKPPFLTASGDLSHHINQLPAPFSTRVEEGDIRVLSGTTWEKEFGYSRAIKTGNQIHISGTTASNGDQLVGGTDPGSQTHFVIDKIEGALQSLGSKLEEVVRTRIYISNMDHWEVIARVHGERFGTIQPANTMVKAELVGDEFLVEIEADAIIRDV